MRKTEKTNYTVERHGETTPVVRFIVDNDGDMVGKTYLLKPNSHIFSITGNVLTENIVERSGPDDEWKVTDVLAVESEALHPDTWMQGTNIFLISGKRYVYFESADNALDAIALAGHGVKKGVQKLAVDILAILVLAIAIYFGFAYLTKRAGLAI